MSRITDYILEPKVVYTEGGFLVRVKVIDDYKYKKYIVSENLHYKTVQGSSFTLTDASSTKQASILELQGNTTQEGTPTPTSPVEVKTVSGDNEVVVCGKNLFDYENTTVSNSYSTVGAKTNNGYLGGWAYIINLPRPIKAGTYFLSYVVENVDNNATANMQFKSKSGITLIQTNAHSNYSNSITFNEDIYTIRVDNGKKAETTLIKNIQLEKGSQATTYEPYIGNSYRVDLKGKNLFNDILRQGVTIYNTGVWGNSNSRITSTDWIKNVKAGTYTISAKTSTTKTLRVSMITFDTNGNFYNISGISGQWKTMPFTFTIPVDMQLKCNISYNNDSNITPSEVTEVQLESGTVETEYSPSNPIELCKIGNYQDKLYYDNGKWYIEKNVGKVVLNGTETWSGTPNYYTSIIQNLIAPTPATERIIALSNNFLVQGYNYKSSNNLYFHPNKNLQIENPNGTYYATVNDWKTWLSTHNTTVYYVLATPTYTEITDSYLLEQLNGLLDIELYEDLCYVDWVGTEKPTMKLQYAGTEDLGIKYIITEDGKKIRTDWRKLGRRKKWMMK